MNKKEIRKMLNDVETTCRMCVHVARLWKDGRNLWGKKDTFYDSKKLADGYEVGCDSNCPFLEKSIAVLG